VDVQVLRQEREARVLVHAPAEVRVARVPLDREREVNLDADLEVSFWCSNVRFQEADVRIESSFNGEEVISHRLHQSTKQECVAAYSHMHRKAPSTVTLPLARRSPNSMSRNTHGTTSFANPSCHPSAITHRD
jgi:predicted nucleotidyltransferase